MNAIVNHAKLAPKRRTLRKNRFARPKGKSTYVEYLRRELVPRIRILEKAHGQMLALVDACDIEVGWLATSARDGRDFVISEIFVPHQRCNPASTVISADGEAKLLTELMAAGEYDTVRSLKCWGHSHVNMAVFASNIDENETSSFLAKEHDHFVRLIANKRRELFASVYLRDEGVAVHDPELVLQKAKPRVWAAWAKQQVAEKVEREPLRYNENMFGEFGDDFDVGDVDAWFAGGFIDEEMRDKLVSRGSQLVALSQ